MNKIIIQNIVKLEHKRELCITTCTIKINYI